MTARNILFSTPMVQELLAGRKTQTRRALRAQPLPPVHRWDLEGDWWMPKPMTEEVRTQFITTWPNAIRCPYGRPGDLLIVRESGWQPKAPTDDELRDGADTWPDYVYDADGYSTVEVEQFKAMGWKRRPSIHMPRRFSRLTLAITDIRVERLQDICEADAKAEGCVYVERPPLSVGYYPAYRDVWETINGQRSWDANPWVWAITFDVHERNVDDVLVEIARS